MDFWWKHWDTSDTSITGPVSSPAAPAHLINPTEVESVLPEMARMLSSVRKAKCKCGLGAAMKEFKAFRRAMEDAGYIWVPRPEQPTMIPGGYFRRPHPNPNGLGPPQKVNRQLREIFENACDNINKEK